MCVYLNILSLFFAHYLIHKNPFFIDFWSSPDYAQNLLLTVQGSLLAMLSKPYKVLEIEPVLDVCQEISLPTILSLQPLKLLPRIFLSLHFTNNVVFTFSLEQTSLEE